MAYRIVFLAFLVFSASPSLTTYLTPPMITNSTATTPAAKNRALAMLSKVVLTAPLAPEPGPQGAFPAAAPLQTSWLAASSVCGANTTPATTALANKKRNQIKPLAMRMRNHKPGNCSCHKHYYQ